MTASHSFNSAGRLGKLLLLAAASAFCLPLGLGCSRGEPASSTEAAAGEHRSGLHDHDHHMPDHRPADLTEAARRLRALHAHVAEEVGHGDVGHTRAELKILLDIVRWVPEIAADSDLPEEPGNEVQRAAKSLEAMYRGVDQRLQRGEALDYAAATREAATHFERIEAAAALVTQ